ncbi:subtilisin-like protease 4 [Typha angustifolia]|uniref:subtilisin-like protease 4 n=1 Tax=Typha angustifolia TaxID=59011 RepID=UPI003C2EC313
MELLDLSSFLSVISFLFLLLSNSYSVRAATESAAVLSDNTLEPKTYIVHVQPPASTAFATPDDQKTWYKSFVPTETRLVHSYTNVVNGFAARLTEHELRDLSAMPGFLRAYPDRLYSLKTTHTPKFLGLQLRGGAWGASDGGRGIIIGVLDTGIFPDHPSFSGDSMPAPPAKWKGTCEFNGSACNNKLIGARAFLSGSNAMKGKEKASMMTAPVDEEGHGTHTASTAAGAMVAGAQVLGEAKGYAVGMAPLAHLAIYKVCDEIGCASSDILAGMDAAVSDGADVLSLSLGGESIPFYEDSIAVGAFGAIAKGVFVSCAAGNSGPVDSTLSNEAPWILTVAASTMDRNIRTTVRLGNGHEYNGESLYQPEMSATTFYPLIYAGASGKPDAQLCGNGSLDGFDVKGKIVFCERGGGIARIEKGAVVASAGGVGMILMNQAPDGYSTLADAHVLPASHVSFADGSMIKSYINSSSSPIATILSKGTVLGVYPAPAVTSFSSRGPSLASPGILKPDITGPGVSVLAAWPFAVGPPSAANSSTTFNIISGTSMSTPHLSGIAALIKSAHPNWSPAAIKSAIMTTADVLDRSGNRVVNELLAPADFFAMGAGHVNPDKAMDPGLIYDLSSYNYIPYLCGLGYTSAQVTVIVRRSIDCSTAKSIPETQLNYPSISVPLTTKIVFVRRTVKNVGDAASVYYAEVDMPKGVRVRVTPAVLRFEEVNQEMSFMVAFYPSAKLSSGQVLQGFLKWTSEKRVVRSPISVTFKG